MADLVQQQTAILQQTAVLVGLHPTDLRFITQTESDLWTTYEARLIQKFGPAAITKIKENPDPLDRVLSLIDEIRKSLISDSAGNLALDNIQANIKILEENRTKERLQREVEAKTKSGEELYQKQLDLLKKLSQKFPVLEKSLPDIAPSLVLEPQGTLEKLSSVIPPEELAVLVPEISDPVIEHLYIRATKITPDLASTFTVFKIANPEATTPEVQKLIDRITLASEASREPISVSEDAVSLLSKISFPTETNLGTLSLTNQFLKADYPLDQSASLAKQFTANFVPIVNTIASFTPHEHNETPQQYSTKVSAVKIFFSNQIIDYLGLQTIYFTNPAQYYGNETVSQSFHPNQEQSGALNFIFNIGKDELSKKAWGKFAASEIGQKVLTKFATEVPKAAAGTVTKTGLAAGITSVLTTLGIADPEPISKAILAALAVVSMFGKQIWDGTKKIFKNLTLVAATGGAAVASAIPISLAGASRGFTAMSSAMVGLVATEIAAPIVITIISIPIVVALLLFIINTSAFVVPPGNSPGFIGYPFSGPGGSISCDPPHEPLGFPNSATNSITSRAWQIVDRLERGFWCYWNKSPDYPELFDAEKIRFNLNPNPKEYTNLFWCTWLVIKAYNESGNILPLQYNGRYTLASNVMLKWFQDQNRYIYFKEAQENMFTGVSPGDVAFVYTGSDSRDVQHVSIVWAVFSGGIQTIDSNAGLKFFTYSVASPTSRACWGSGCTMHIVGFGKYVR